jgi:hypothetical protein
MAPPFLRKSFVAAILFALSLHAASREQPCGRFQNRRPSGDALEGELNDILLAHQRWLQKYPIEHRGDYNASNDPDRANFCEANLEDVSFFVADLQYADFSKAKLSRANFTGANIAHANFSGADLKGANFLGTDVTGTLLGGADLQQLRYEPKLGTSPSSIAIRRARTFKT